MDVVFSLSYGLLWLTVIVLVAGFIALTRQIALLYTRLPQFGARLQSTGPDVGAVVERVELKDMSGRPAHIPSLTHARTLVIFMTATCRSCAALAPAVRGIAETEKNMDVVVVTFAGTADEARTALHKLKLGSLVHVHSLELARKWVVHVTPFAFVLGRDGRVAAKGLVDNREQLDSLLTAIDLDVESLDAFMRPKGEMLAIQ